jgi:hypothetical protein
MGSCKQLKKSEDAYLEEDEAGHNGVGRAKLKMTPSTYVNREDYCR